MSEGRVAIVTGGASGIGHALGKALAARGVEVVLADRDAEGAERAAEDVRRRGGNASAASLDVRDFDAFRALADETKRRAGRLDYLFNNAGVAVSGTVADYTPDDWNYIIDVNLRGVAWGIQAVYGIMREQGFGHIINTASIAGLFAAALGSYTMTKHGVVGISKALRIEAARYGVRVSALCPGVIRTPILKGGKYGRKRGLQLSESRMTELWERIRPMDADEFARQALRKIDRNVAIIVVPSSGLMFWAIERLSIGLSLTMGLRVARKTQAIFDAEGVPAPSEPAERS